jgi:hypothetical protein
MAKRESAGQSTRSTEAARANLAKGRQAKRDIAAAARAAGQMKAKERWAMLLSGTITVRDLDNDEVRKMKVRNADGTMGGKRRAIPSHLVQAFQAEQLRRFSDRLRKGLDTSGDVLLEIMKDPEAKHSDRLRAAQMLQDRVLGKAPETVRIEGVSEWDLMFNDSVDVERADLDAEAERMLEDQA